jgi:signal transduction histidine kinase
MISPKNKRGGENTEEEYKEHVRKRLDGIIIILQKIALGDFSENIDVPEKEDEFTRLLIALNFMINDLEEVKKISREAVVMETKVSISSEQVARLKEINRVKSEFVSITAHQLRTPLSGIKWASEIILEKTKEIETKKWIEKVTELNEGMIGIINDLLNAARIEEGRFGYKFEKWVNMSALLEKIVESYRIEVEERGLGLDFSRNSLEYLYSRVDSEKLKIALNNLIDNAIHYTEKGSIKIKLEKSGDSVIIKIQDTGIGISENNFDKLFSKFFRGENAISFRPSGSGIGLFITRNIIEVHKGKIWFESKLNQGTIFYIKLPLTKVEEKN